MLFVDSDGRLTDLLSQLKIETSKVAPTGDLVNLSEGLESGFDLYQADLSPSLLAHLLDTFGPIRQLETGS